MKKKRRVLLITIAVLAWLMLMASLLYFGDGRTVRFYMTGEQEISIEQGTEFSEPGIYAVTTGRIFGESEKHLPVDISGTVDSGSLGQYRIDYSVRCLFGSFATHRLVNVVDTQPPVIELEYIEGYKPTWIDGYQEEGYSAHDNCDGDITAKVQRQQFPDRIVYSVSDASGNETQVERPLPDYTDLPLITLKGGDYMEIYAGDDFTEPGYSAMDGLGNDLTGRVLAEGKVTSWQAGEYYLTYSLLSADGVGVSTTRVVNVLPKPQPQTYTPDGRVIYLTFDDGPGPYTGRLLDLLSAYGVPATFFVTAADSRYYDLIGRAYREGHSIGVHTATHNYSQIYASEEAWFDDFYTMQDIIYEQTGEYAQIFRFPGGSSNTVSRFNPGIMTRLSRIMTDLGYRYFDWNVSSGDAGETNQTQEIVDNIIAGCQSQRISVVLQHDIKDYSVAAVEQVINWGRNNGYSFRALDMQSPANQHGINN